MKTKTQLSTKTLRILMYLLGGLLFITIVALFVMVGEQTKQINQKDQQCSKIEHDLSWKILYSWAKIDSLDSVSANKDTLILRLEEQKKQLQAEIYRLQPYEMQTYNLGVSLESARDSISQLLLFKNHLDYDTRFDLFKEEVSGKIKAYPNPFGGWIAIQNHGGIPISRIQVVNVESQLAKVVLNPNCNSIPMSELSPGTYNLSIFTNFEGKDVQVKVEKIIKK